MRSERSFDSWVSRLRGVTLSILAVFVLGPVTEAEAQPFWRNISPPAGYLGCVIGSPYGPTMLYACPSSDGVYKSADAGSSWFPGRVGFPAGSLVRELAADPKKDGTVLAASSYGLFETTNAGESWSLLPVGIEDVQAVAIDSRTGDILAGGAGEYLYRSSDGGVTWQKLKFPVSLGYLNQILISPADSSTIVVNANTKGYYRSTDGGVTWTVLVVPSGGYCCYDLSLDPNDSRSMVVGGHEGIHRTSDLGSSWTKVLDQPDVEIISDPSARAELFAYTYPYQGGRLYRSRDAGRTWSPSGAASPGGRIVGLVGGWLFASDGRYLVVSTDGGATWTRANVTKGTYSIRNARVDPFQHTRVVASSDGGGAPGFRSDDSGVTWKEIHQGWIVPHDFRSGRWYAGYYRGVARSDDSGDSWTEVALPEPPSHAIPWAFAFSPSDPNLILMGAYNFEAGIYRSTDAGASWQRSSSGISYSSYLNVRTIAVDPGRSTTFLAGTSGGGVYRSTNLGATWAATNSGFGSTLDIRTLVFDPSSPRTVYAATRDGVFRSLDSGASWSRRSDGLPAARIWGLAIDPRSSNVLYAGVTTGEGGVYRSTDGGASWSRWGTGLEGAAYSIAVDPVDTGIVYAGTSTGLYSTNSALPSDCLLTCLALVPSTGTAGVAVAFSASVLASNCAGGPSFAWSFGDGTSSISRNPSHTYAGAGTYDWKVTVQQDGASCTKSGRITITATGFGENSLLVPIVLDVATATTRYTTDLSITNRGATNTIATFTYTPSLGSKAGGGSVSETIFGGQQRVIPNVLVFLRSRGLAVPDSTGSNAQQGGTLQVKFAGAESEGSVAATARTTAATTAPQPVGVAGLSYSGIRRPATPASALAVYGLRQDDQDRSNLAVFNLSPDPVAFRVTAYSGDGSGNSRIIKESETIGGYGWVQYSSLLSNTGITQGWVIVEKTSGAGSLGAYGVINDNGTSDGSYVMPTAGSFSGNRLTVPVLVETSAFKSELVLTNRSGANVSMSLSYVESASPQLGAGGPATVTLKPKEQKVIPDAIEFLRRSGVQVGTKGVSSYVGALRITVSGASLSEVFAGARTASQSQAGGQFGLFTPCVYSGQEAAAEAYLYGLRADSENRSNVAVLNAGTSGDGSVTLEIRTYDGDLGGAERGNAEVVALVPGQWKQYTNFLKDRGIRNGWVKVRRTGGTAPWIAYGVMNDGANPGERTGDGAYVPMTR